MLKHIILALCFLLPSISFSASVLVTKDNEIIYSQNTNKVIPIASITKLMSAIVILESGLDLNKSYKITEDDVDKIKHSHSRLPVGAIINGRDLLLVGLMSSDNRAISALMRNHPKGLIWAVAEMNMKAHDIGMNNTYFAEPTGLNPMNESTPEDLIKLVNHASKYPLISEFTTTKHKTIVVGKRRLSYLNSNRLVRRGDWNSTIVSKTGYINEAGMCVVMQTKTASDTYNIVVMDAGSNAGRFAIVDSLRKRNVIK